MGINANKLRTSYTRNANGTVLLISLKSAANVLDMHHSCFRTSPLFSSLDNLIRLCSLFIFSGAMLLMTLLESLLSATRRREADIL